jgi:hypothetical protein
MDWRRKDVPLLGAKAIADLNEASKRAAAPQKKDPEAKEQPPAPARQVEHALSEFTEKRRARKLAAEHSDTVSKAVASLLEASTPEARQQYVKDAQAALDKIKRAADSATFKNDRKAARRIYKSSKGVQRVAAAYAKAYGRWYAWFFQWRIAQTEKRARGSRYSLGKD